MNQLHSIHPLRIDLLDLLDDDFDERIEAAVQCEKDLEAQGIDVDALLGRST